MLILGESPSGVQLLGAATILAGLVVVSTGRRSRTPVTTAARDRQSPARPAS